MGGSWVAGCWCKTRCFHLEPEVAAGHCPGGTLTGFFAKESWQQRAVAAIAGVAAPRDLPFRGVNNFALAK